MASTGVLTAEQEQQIKALSDQYFASKAKNDYAGMQSANNQANAIRAGVGVKAVNASVDIENIKQKALAEANNTVSASVQPNTTVTATSYDPTQYINELKEAQKREAISRLTKSRNQGLSNLSAEEATINPKYYEAQRNTIGQSQAGVRTFNDYLASKGLQSSGLAGAGEINRLNTLNSNIGTLENQKTQAFSDIARRRSGIENAYLNDLEATQAGIDAQTMQALINQANTNRQFDQTQQQIDRNIFESDRAFEYQKSLNELNRADQLKEIEWQRSADNPENKLRLLQIEAQEIQNANLPQQMKNEAALIQIQLQQGQISLDTAKEQLRRLKQTPISTGNGTSVSQQNAENKAKAQQITGNVQTYLDQWARGNVKDQNGRADQNDMLNYLKTNSGTLTAQGVDVNALTQWVKNNYTWVR